MNGANVRKPNSSKFTQMIAYAHVKDSPKNLKVIFEDLKSDIETLAMLHGMARKYKFSSTEIIVSSPICMVCLGQMVSVLVFGVNVRLKYFKVNA